MVRANPLNLLSFRYPLAVLAAAGAVYISAQCISKFGIYSLPLFAHFENITSKLIFWIDQFTYLPFSYFFKQFRIASEHLQLVEGLIMTLPGPEQPLSSQQHILQHQHQNIIAANLYVCTYNGQKPQYPL